MLPPGFLKNKRVDDYEDDSDDSNSGGDENKTKNSKLAPISDVTNIVKQDKAKAEPAKAEKPQVKKDVSKLSWMNNDIDIFDDDSDDEMNLPTRATATTTTTTTTTSTPTGPISWDKIPKFIVARTARDVRRKEYREACERLKKWFEAVDALDLPVRKKIVWQKPCTVDILGFYLILFFILVLAQPFGSSIE